MYNVKRVCVMEGVNGDRSLLVCGLWWVLALNGDDPCSRMVADAFLEDGVKLLAEVFPWEETR